MKPITAILLFLALVATLTVFWSPVAIGLLMIFFPLLPVTPVEWHFKHPRDWEWGDR